MPPGMEQLKRLELSGNRNAPNFVGSWTIEPASLCADIVDFFESRPDMQKTGKTYGGFDAESKRSMDITVYPRDLELEDYLPLRTYIDRLYECFADYVAQWPFLGTLGRFNIGPFNIQRYAPGGHFNQIHTERNSVANSHRILAWMTYLNDVAAGGSTYFPHFDLDIRPETGKTLIWPAEWTHAHRGNTVTEGVKYIVTGWMHFPA